MSAQDRPSLLQTVQQFNATPAGDLIGYKSQVVPDGVTGSIAADVESNLHVGFNSGIVTFTGLDLSLESTPPIPHTFHRRGSGLINVAPTQLINAATTSVQLDADGASVTLAPVINDTGALQWMIIATFGTVTFTP